MIAHILYTKDSPSEREVQGLARDLAQLRVDTELVEADSREGISLTEMYDLTSRPAMVLTRNDGTLVERWVNAMPLATDVSYLAHQ